MAENSALLRDALATIERLQKRLDAAQQRPHEPIAIVGLGCRYPGAVDTIEGLWRVVSDGVDAVHDVPPDRWDIDAYYDPDPAAAGKMVTRRAGMLERVDGFDPGYFGISPREARSLDPQQRLLLETSVEALDSAGIAADGLAGSLTGVFVGASTNDYGRMMWTDVGATSDPYAATGGALNALAGRVAFTFGLRGPCLTLDTACSSGLAAIHLAAQSLRAHECDLALAGGVNVILLPDAMVLFSRWGMLAPDGRSKTFDAAADGMVRAEGCGLIALKRLSDARAAGDPIRAVLLGTAVNSDGRSSGLTVPNGPAQEAVLRAALASAGIRPADVDYVEAHGTGTPLGDPIEVEALAAAYGPGRPPDRPLVIGAVKANFGHTEAASGLAGVLKTIAALEHEELPAQIHYATPNPRVDWTALPLRVVQSRVAWPRGARKRRAGVSAFGLSGTNAHVVMEEAPEAAPPAEAQPGPHIVPLSAHGETALRELATRHADALDAGLARLVDMAATLAQGRAHSQRRVALTADSEADLATQLRAVAAGRPPAGAAQGVVRSASPARIAFLFTGQGAQYAGMGRGLYETEPVFRDVMHRAMEVLGEREGRPLLDAILGESDETLSRTRYTQPALFTVEIALAELWRSWGVTPAFVLGHSVGEYAAAHVAGMLSFEDGLKLIAERARLMDALPAGGAMAALFTSAADAEARLAGTHGRVSIAAFNGPNETVISGDADVLDAVLDMATADGVAMRRLEVSHAFHSARLEPMLGAFEAHAGRTRFAAARMALISNLTGEIMRQAPDARYWRRHAREPVQFAASIARLRAEGVTALVEIGPHPTLLALATRAAPDAQWVTAPSLRRGRDDRRQIQEALGALYVTGASPKWSAVQARSGGRRVPLPSYPFQRARYWIDPPKPKRHTPNDGHPLLGARRDVAALKDALVWEAEISLDAHPWLADHRVQGRAIVPATAYLELAFAAGAEVLGPGALSIRDAENERPILLREGEVRVLQTTLTHEGSQRRLDVASRPSEGGPWTQHFSACLASLADDPGRMLDVKACQKGTVIREGVDFYAALAAKSNEWGPTFQGVSRLWLGEEVALAEVRAPAGVSASGRFRFHPALADACGHVLVAALEHRHGGAPAGALVGGGVSETRLYRSPGAGALWAQATLRPEASDGNVMVGDVSVFDATGALIAETRGTRLQRLDETGTVGLVGAPRDWFYEVRWAPHARGSPGDGMAPNAPWLVFDGHGAGGRIAESRAADGRRTIVARHGKAYAFAGDRVTVRAREPEDLVRAVRDSGTLGAIVYLADCSASDDPGAMAAAAIKDVLALARSARSSDGDGQPRLWIVTAGAQPATRDGCRRPWQAALWGLGKTLSVEHAELWGGLVDLDADTAPHAAAGQVIMEVAAAGVEDRAAYRGGDRFTPRLVRRSQPVADTFRARPEATYLVTGGLGGIGLEMAQWLAIRRARSLLLLGRTPLPERSQWDQLAHDRQAGRPIATIRAVEKLGCTVHVASVDVSHERELQACFSMLKARGAPPVRGIVHAAGVVNLELLAEVDEKSVRAQIAARVDGTWHLHRHFSRPGDLDFFVLCSTPSAFLPPPFMGVYAAGHAFLDAIAHYRRGLGLAALSVNWGAWGETGLALTKRRGALFSGFSAMPTASALAALGALLSGEDVQTCVMPADWAKFAASYPAISRDPFLDALTGTPELREDVASSVVSSAVLLAAEPRERAEMVTTYLQERVASALGFPAGGLDPAIPLVQAGFDSLVAVQVKARIYADLAVVVPMVALLQGGSIRELACTLLELLEAAPFVEPEPVLEWEEGTL